MGHETYSRLFDGNLSKSEAKDKFIAGLKNICSCDRPRISSSDIADCYITGATLPEVEQKFDKVLSDRYGGDASIAKVNIPDEDKARKTKAYISLQEKLKVLRDKIDEIVVEGFKSIKEKKTKKCTGCQTVFQTETLRFYGCPNCQTSLLGKGHLSKIEKLNLKIKEIEAKQIELVKKQPKVEKWLLGIEYHT